MVIAFVLTTNIESNSKFENLKPFLGLDSEETKNKTRNAVQNCDSVNMIYKFFAIALKIKTIFLVTASGGLL